jgi:hypothetical protein
MQDIFPIDSDHSNMVKFAQNSVDYRVIAGKLCDLSQIIEKESSIVRKEIVPLQVGGKSSTH